MDLLRDIVHLRYLCHCLSLFACSFTFWFVEHNNCILTNVSLCYFWIDSSFAVCFLFAMILIFYITLTLTLTFLFGYIIITVLLILRV